MILLIFKFQDLQFEIYKSCCFCAHVSLESPLYIKCTMHLQQVPAPTRVYYPFLIEILAACNSDCGATFLNTVAT